MIKPGYTYRAEVISVYDGDTITVDIDLGLGVWVCGQTLRLYGIDTPELRGEERPEGLKVRDWLLEKLMGRPIVVQTLKDDKGKYGRWLAIVWLDGENVNDELLLSGRAKPYGL